MMSRMRSMIEKNPVRIAAFISSAVALFVPMISPDLPVDQAVIFILAALGLGEFAQRVENRKTEEASAPKSRKK
jgi:hypothetical protein